MSEPLRESLVGVRSKDKRERTTEALTDLQVAIRGLRPQTPGQYVEGELVQVLGTFARMCSIFLRKLVLGDMGRRDSRLLDDAVMSTVSFGFQPVRRMRRKRHRTIMTGLAVGGGVLQLTKLDELGPGPLPTYRLPFAPHDVSFAIAWPLLGTADWVGTPSETEPWTLCAEQLFDTASTRVMTCDQWLGQQVVRFDGRAISLKEILQTVVNFEGAHAINVTRLAETEKHRPSAEARKTQLHLLNNITMFGVRYFHIIVIESALYLYEKLLEDSTVQNPKGETYLVRPGFHCTREEANARRPSWLGFDGTITMLISGKGRTTRYAIERVGG